MRIAKLVAGIIALALASVGFGAACVPPGCAGSQARACPNMPLNGCRAGVGCGVITGCASSCYLLDAKTCRLREDCTEATAGCAPRRDGCSGLGIATCEENRTCQWGNHCVGEARTCDAIADERTCLSVPDCDWITGAE